MFRVLSALFILNNLICRESVIANELSNNMEIKDLLENMKKWHNHDMLDGEYPFVVSVALIQPETSIVTRHCTGSMLTKIWVLSSSYCYYDLLHKKFYVWYGNYTESPLESNMYSKVLKIHIHPRFHADFSRPGYFFGDFDISLLRTVKVDLPKYGRLAYIDHTKMFTLPVTYIGGSGKTNLASDQLRPLQIAEGTVINCGSALTMWSQYVLCVSPNCTDKLHHPLHGDFGGPFIYEGKIVGVMTLNIQSPKRLQSVNGLTPVSPYKEWIWSVMRTKGNKKYLL